MLDPAVFTHGTQASCKGTASVHRLLVLAFTTFFGHDHANNDNSNKQGRHGAKTAAVIGRRGAGIIIVIVAPAAIGTAPIGASAVIAVTRKTSEICPCRRRKCQQQTQNKPQSQELSFHANLLLWDSAE